MPNLLQSAAAWLGAQLQTAAGRSVVIVRSGVPSDALTAWVSVQEYTVVDEEGFGTVVESHDWSFVTSDLPYPLRSGDVIRETLGGLRQEYTILPVAGKPFAEWVDTSGVMTVAHSRKTEEECPTQ